MRWDKSSTLKLRDTHDNAFCERLKQIIRCLSPWPFTRKTGEIRVLRGKVWPDPLLLGVAQQRQGPEGACHGIPVGADLARSALPASQNPEQEKLADL